PAARAGWRLVGGERTEPQPCLPPLIAAAADDLRSNVCHLQVADVDVVQEYGTVVRVCLCPAECLELLRDVGYPAFGGPADRAKRGRMARVGEQGGVGPVGRASFGRRPDS